MDGEFLKTKRKENIIKNQVLGEIGQIQGKSMRGISFIRLYFVR
jgi:hypothetical protein